MISLIKKDLMLARPWEYLIVASMVALIYYVPDLIFTITVIVLTITFFFYDHYYKMNRYVHSLPVSPNTIVLSRYVSAYAIVIAILSFQYIVTSIITLFNASVYVYSFEDMLILICVATVFIAVVIPIYHLFKSFYTASIVFFGFLIIPTITFLNLSRELVIIESVDPDILWTASSESLSILDTIKEYITTDNYGIIGISIVCLFGLSTLLSLSIYKIKNVA